MADAVFTALQDCRCPDGQEVIKAMHIFFKGMHQPLLLTLLPKGVINSTINIFITQAVAVSIVQKYAEKFRLFHAVRDLGHGRAGPSDR